MDIGELINSNVTIKSERSFWYIVNENGYE